MPKRTDLKFFAEYFHELGLNISFISNESSKYNFLFNPKRLKEPFYEWESYLSERQSKNIINKYEWEKCFGIGAVLGFNNLAAIDLDGCVNEEIVLFILDYLHLPNNYDWVIKSGSQAGYHIIFTTKRPDKSNKRNNKTELGYYQSLDDTFGKVDVNAYYPLDNIGDDIMPRAKGNELLPRLINHNSFEKIEFKWTGHIILPPSVHSSGRLYTFLNKRPKTEPSEISFELLSELQILISGKYAQDSSRNGKSAAPDHEEILIDGQSAVVFDCETNGLPADFKKHYTDVENWPRLLQISWLVCGRNYPKGEFSEFQEETLNLSKRETRNVLPKNFDIDPKGELIHSLSADFLTSVGEDLKDILRDFTEDVKKCSLIVGYNLKYDLSIIKSEFLRCGMDVSFFNGKTLFCTMENSVDICKIGSIPYKFPSLPELYFSCFKKRISVEHNSIFDAFLTMKCFNQIGEIYGRERYEIHLNRIRQKRKKFDNEFDSLSGVEKLRMAIEENEYFPFYNPQALNSIRQEDIMMITVEERNNLYKRIERLCDSFSTERWTNIKMMIELVDFPKPDDLPF